MNWDKCMKSFNCKVCSDYMFCKNDISVKKEEAYMNLNQMIRIKMIELSNKYDMSLVEVSKIKDGRLCKTINFNYRLLNSNPVNNTKETFHNKRSFVSWLMCLE